MKTTDDYFAPLVAQAGRNFPPNNNPRNSGQHLQFILILLGVLAFVGVETVKIIFRKNFGQKGLSIGKIILCFLVFVGIGIISISIYTQNEDSESVEMIGSTHSFLITSIFYFLLGIFVFVKGLIDKAKSNQLKNFNPYFRGESTVLSFLIKDGWSPSRVQNVAEPLLTLATGVFLAVYNLLLGIPIIFCALSVWVYQIFEQTIGGMNVVDNTMQQKGHDRGRDFTEIQN